MSETEIKKYGSYCGINMTEKSIRKIERFKSVHLKRCAKGRGLLQFLVTPTGGFGVEQLVICIECGAIRDITDINLW